MAQNPDWSSIDADIAKGDRSIADIARAHGVSPNSLYKRKARQKRAVNHQVPQSVATVSSYAKDKAEASDHAAIVQRLYKATEHQIQHLEEKLQSGEAAFDEKEARMLGTIARTLDKIMDLTPKPDDETTKTATRKPKQEAGHDEDEQAATVNLDRLRQDLARRLEGLQLQTKSGASGKPE